MSDIENNPAQKHVSAWVQVSHITELWGYDLILDGSGLRIAKWSLPAGYGGEGRREELFLPNPAQVEADFRALFEGPKQ